MAVVRQSEHKLTFDPLVGAYPLVSSHDIHKLYGAERETGVCTDSKRYCIVCISLQIALSYLLNTMRPLAVARPLLDTAVSIGHYPSGGKALSLRTWRHNHHSRPVL